MAYSRNQNILIVGDGNFSFALSLAKQLEPLEKMFVCGTKDTLAQVQAKYKDSANNLKQLRKIRGGVTIRYQMDSRKLEEQVSSRFYYEFDRIIWNFPFAGRASIRENQRLLIHFLVSASSFLHENGEIHIRLCNYQSEDWQISEILKDTHLKLKQMESFDDRDFPGYTRRCDNEDKAWEIYPNSARTLVITHRIFGYEKIVRKLLLDRWHQCRESLHSQCGQKRKRKETEQVESKRRSFSETLASATLMPPISDQTRDFIQGPPQVPSTSEKHVSTVQHHLHLYIHTEGAQAESTEGETTGSGDSQGTPTFDRQSDPSNPYLEFVQNETAV